jgi:hypothetical protein
MKSYDTDSEDAIERWQQNMYEVSTQRCARITKAIHYIEIELCDALCFDGRRSVESFLVQMEKIIPEY